MDENIKNLREAQQQSGAQKNENGSTDDTEAVEVQISSREQVEEEARNEPLVQREDTLKDDLSDQIADPMMGEELSDSVVKEGEPKKKTPLKKLMVISKKLKLRMAKDAFVEDDPAAFTDLLREVRALATHDFTQSEVDMLHGFRTELELLKKRAKKSASKTELTPFESSSRCA